MQSERRRVAKILQEHRSLIAPIRRLPVEVLSKVFLCGDLASFDESKGPLLFAVVCNRWRSVAISTQALWSSIDFEVKYLIPPLKIIHLWLARSGSHPLNILWPNPYNGHDDSAARQAVFVALLSHQSRWREIEFGLAPEQLDELTAVSSGSFPHLRKLKLEAGHSHLPSHCAHLRLPHLSRTSISASFLGLANFHGTAYSHTNRTVRT